MFFLEDSEYLLEDNGINPDSVLNEAGLLLDMGRIAENGKKILNNVRKAVSAANEAKAEEKEGAYQKKLNRCLERMYKVEQWLKDENYYAILRRMSRAPRWFWEGFISIGLLFGVLGVIVVVIDNNRLNDYAQSPQGQKIATNFAKEYINICKKLER